MAPKLQASGFAALPVGGKVFILIAGLGLISAGYYLGFHMSLEEEATAASRRHGELEAELAEAHKRRKQHLSLRQELSARENLDKQYMRILPEDAEIPAFLDDINRLAELSGLDMSNVAPNPEESEEFFVKVPFSLSIKGRYHQMAKFFYNISRLERAINMEDITLGVENVSQAGEVTLNASVMATTFRRPEQGAGQ